MARGRAAPASLPLGFRQAKLNAYAAARDISATSRYPRGNDFVYSRSKGFTHPYDAGCRRSRARASTPWQHELHVLSQHTPCASLRRSFAHPCNAGCEHSRAAGFAYSRGNGFALQNAMFTTITMRTTAADAARISSRLWTIRRAAVSSRHQLGLAPGYTCACAADAPRNPTAWGETGIATVSAGHQLQLSPGHTPPMSTMMSW